MTKVGIVYAITGVACPRRGGNSLLLDKLESGIVALETEYGPVYVQPSGWERLYLLWTFRHFNSLPLKTLNSRQRRLVERLPRCGTRSLRSGVDGLRVIGTVEGAKAPLDSTPLSSEVDTLPEPIEIVPIPVEAFAPFASSELQDGNHNLTEASKIRPSLLARKRSPSKMAFALAIAALIAVLAEPAWHRLQSAQTLNTATVVAPAPVAETGSTPAATASEPSSAPTELPPTSIAQPVLDQAVQPAAIVVTSEPETTLPAPRRSIETPAAIISPLQPHAIQSTIKQTPAKDSAVRIRNKENPILASIQEGKVQEETPRIRFSGPPRRLVYPDYPDTKVRGKVSLNAVIDADGKVREVKILSGNKILSAAAARAIRQWRYEPFLKDGQRVEAETNVGVLFVSADVISLSFPQPAAQISQ